MISYNTIFEFITSQETAYSLPVPINNNWRWSMKEHIELTVLYKNSQLKSGKNEYTPVKNITLPILRLQYRAEGFDVKDIQLFVNDKDDYYKSFLIRKFHEKWARENDIDTFIDELVESYVDYGGVLVKDLNSKKPEVVHLETIAFCDQTDMLSGPIGIKHFYSPDQLLDMKKVGWGDTKNGATISIPELITLSREEKKEQKDGQVAQTPGRYIEIYEVHGNMPKVFFNPNDTSGEYETRLCICAFYQKKGSTEKQGVILYSALETESPFKMLLRDGIYGRALGFGGAEELFEAQVWTNYDQIRMQDMLEAASKTIMKYIGPGLKNRQKIRDMDNLEMLELDQGEDVTQVDIFPRNMKLFEQSTAEWNSHAHDIGSATGALLGEMPTSHTSYNMMALITSQGQAIHDYRRGKIATFVGEIYRDWILPYIVKEIVQGQEFLAELDMEELQSVADAVVMNGVNDMVRERILNGELIDPTEIDALKQQMRDSFMKRGNKHFIEIFKGEMKEAPIDVEVSIANKQKDLGKVATELKGMFQFIFSTYNPQTGSFAVFDDPRMAGLLNQVLEASGMDQIDTFANPKPIALPAPTPPTAPVPSPIQSKPVTA